VFDGIYGGCAQGTLGAIHATTFGVCLLGEFNHLPLSDDVRVGAFLAANLAGAGFVASGNYFFAPDVEYSNLEGWAFCGSWSGGLPVVGQVQGTVCKNFAFGELFNLHGFNADPFSAIGQGRWYFMGGPSVGTTGAFVGPVHTWIFDVPDAVPVP
jgi:hypothetical protein